jgi:hypothetical protein
MENLGDCVNTAVTTAARHGAHRMPQELMTTM